MSRADNRPLLRVSGQRERRQSIGGNGVKAHVGYAVAIALLIGPALAQEAAAKPTATILHVDDDASAGGDGSAKRPFTNLADAVGEARARAVPTVIAVRPGDYPQAATLRIDVPLEIRGSTQQIDDPGDPWPTGVVVPGTQTRIFGTSALGSQPLVTVGRADAEVLPGFTFSGFVLESTATSNQLALVRVQGYRVAGNIFRAPGAFAFESVASSGTFEGNRMDGVGTGAIFAGGYPESPSSVAVTGNRAINNTLGGLLLIGASYDIPELGDRLDAVVRENDLSGNVGAQGFGLRVFVQRRDANAQTSSHVHGDVRDNRIVGNRIGVTIDAGFPYRSVAGTCDPRTFSGTIELDLRRNVVAESRDAGALITFTRSTAARNQSTLALWQYLHAATIEISDPDATLLDAWIDHPAADPFVGPCVNDQVHEPLGNVLRYNGTELPNGRNF